MDKVRKGLTSVELILSKLQQVEDMQRRAVDCAKQKMDGASGQNKLVYHDMYRQLKAEYKVTYENIESVYEIRDGIQQNGYVWQYKLLLRKIEKYADVWLRAQLKTKEEVM